MNELDTEKIQALMAERGLSQRALARKAGTTSPHVNHIVNDVQGTRGLSFNLACRIADALGVKLDALRKPRTS